ncbi:MAG: SDR family NAD(P)-dependent oxidoreductase [Acidobacteriaceae bacterium]|nr:SDR family NAD(P)-dependent oxidoreductase [Acidobacteriaceae bacterium]
MREFRDRTAVITGGASGIGRAMAERFASEGMRIVLADIEETPLRETAEAMRQNGATVLACRVDVTNAVEVETLAEAAYKEFGAVHLLCNNAGVISEGAPVWKESLENWAWVLGVNFWGVLHGIRAFVPRMIASGEEGHVVNTASVAGLTTRPLMASYNVSKHAVVAVSECLHAELQLTTDKVRASVLCPAFARTRLAESTRNRPHDPETHAETSYGFHEAWKAVVEQGTPPEEIAGRVMEAVRNEQFWILTHPNTDKAVRERFESMLARTNPEARDLRPQASRLKP